MPVVVEGRTVSSPFLQKPFRLMVCGGSGCGKSLFVKELVEKNYFASSFDKIIYNYPEYLNEIPLELDVDVECKKGLLTQEYFASVPRNTLVILDDLMLEVGCAKEIVKLFAVTARKRDISLILITQNVYHQSRHFRNIRLNATGFVLFKFYAGTDVNFRLIRDLGMQSILPKKLLDEIYTERYQYIFIDIHPDCQYDFGRCRGNIFEKYISVYNKMEYIALPKSEFENILK